MTINRLNTRTEFWLFLIKIAFILIGFPFLLFIGIVLLLTLPQQSSRVPGDVEGTILVWSIILATVAIFVYRINTRRKLLRSVVSNLRSQNYFSPNENHEVFHAGDCKYFGIDIRNGTILYVHKIRSGQMDVIGLSMSDWTAKEVQGNVFRLYTRNPELPMIQIGTRWAKQWFDTLDAMTTNQYSTPTPFPQYVNGQIDTLKSKYLVYIPKLA